jgi:hypothetical protein
MNRLLACFVLVFGWVALVAGVYLERNAKPRKPICAYLSLVVKSHAVLPYVGKKCFNHWSTQGCTCGRGSHDGVPGI